MPGTVTVINIKNVNGFDAVYIGRPSVFGNPFSVRMGRTTCIARYGMRFAELMSCETPLKAAVDRLVLRVYNGEDIKLACFCAPLPCHGDTIKAYIEVEVEKMHRMAAALKEQMENRSLT